MNPLKTISGNLFPFLKKRGIDMTDEEQAMHKELSREGFRSAMRKVTADNVVTFISNCKAMKRHVSIAAPQQNDEGVPLDAMRPGGASGDGWHQLG